MVGVSNFSLSFLTLSGFSLPSPYISYQQPGSCTKLSIENSNFRYFTSHAIYSSLAPYLASIRDSKFRHFLNNAVSLSSVTLNETIRTRPSKFYHPSLIFDHCMFMDCVSDQQGGAIFYSYEGGYLHSLRTIFVDDYCDSHGGGLYFEGHSYLIVRNCFKRCSAILHGQSYYFIIAAQTPDIVNDTIVSECSPEPKSRNGRSTHIQGGASSFAFCNFTYNYLETGASSISVASCNTESISFCVFDSCQSSGSLIEIASSSIQSEVRKSNFFNNTVYNSILIRFSYSTIIQDCYFIKNSRPVTTQAIGKTASIQFIGCIYDSLGLTPRDRVETVDCKNIGIDETAVPIEPRFIGQCNYYGVDQKSSGAKFAVILPLLLTVAIAAVHTLLIHPHAFGLLYEYLFFDTNTKRRRVRAQIGTAARVD